VSSPSRDRRRASVPPELTRFLAALFGPTPGALIDIRVRRREGAMDQHFMPVRGRRAARLIAELGADADVYLGVGGGGGGAGPGGGGAGGPSQVELQTLRSRLRS
jgi:hypothetical protein